MSSPFDRPRSLISAAVSGMLLTAGCASSEPTIQADAQQRWDEYRAAVKYELANEELRRGGVDRAISLAHEVGALSPNHPAHAELLAKAYMSRGDFSAARKVLEPACGTYPEQGNLHYLMGVVYQRDADWPAAAKAFGAAAAADVSQLDYHIAAAQATARFASQLAIDDLIARADRFDFEPRFHLTLAELKRDAGDADGACRAFRRAMELGADGRETRESIAMCLYQLDRFAEAREQLAPLLAGFPDAASPLALPYVRCLMETGSLDAALTRLERHTAARPNDAAAWMLLAQARATGDDLEFALLAADRAVTLKPDSSDAQLLLAALRVAGGRTFDAISTAQKAIEADPKNTEAYLLLGRIFERLSDESMAVEMYREAIRIEPEHEIASKLLARLNE